MNRYETKGMIGGIQKFSTEDGPGIRTTVFLKGCPLNCRWCHNPELIEPVIQLMRCPGNCVGCGACTEVCPNQAITISEGKASIDWFACGQCLKCAEVCWSKALNAAGKLTTAGEVMLQVIQDKDFYLHTGGGLTISGGELLSQPEFTEALLEIAWENGIGTVLDTSGYGSPETLLRLAEHRNCTHILFDLKHMDPEEHRYYTGMDNELILGNLEALAKEPSIRSKIQIRIPLISGVNDSDENIEQVCRFLKAHGLMVVTLLPYHELGVSKRRNIGGGPENFQKLSTGRIDEITSYFNDYGMRVEVLGGEKDC
jgi:pyruvate formate lyase activating enzyme